MRSAVAECRRHDFQEPKPWSESGQLRPTGRRPRGEQAVLKGRQRRPAGRANDAEPAGWRQAESRPELVSNVAKLEQKTGLAVDALEQQLSSLAAEVAELGGEALLTLNTRPTTTAPRSFALITHADGTTSTLTEVTGVAGC